MALDFWYFLGALIGGFFEVLLLFGVFSLLSRKIWDSELSKDKRVLIGTLLAIALDVFFEDRIRFLAHIIDGLLVHVFLIKANTDISGLRKLTK